MSLRSNVVKIIKNVTQGGEKEPAMSFFDETPAGKAKREAQIEARTTELAQALKEGLSKINRVKVLTPMDPKFSGGVVVSTVAGFDNQKMDVLRTLIRNPAFSNAAKQNILVNLNKLSFDNQRAEILRLINDRGELKN